MNDDGFGTREEVIERYRVVAAELARVLKFDLELAKGRADKAEAEVASLRKAIMEDAVLERHATLAKLSAQVTVDRDAALKEVARLEAWWIDHGSGALRHYAERAEKAETENRAWAKAFKQTILPGHEGPEGVAKFIKKTITEHQDALREAREALAAADEAMCEVHNSFENWDLEGWRQERAKLAKARLTDAIRKTQKALGVECNL